MKNKTAEKNLKQLLINLKTKKLKTWRRPEKEWTKFNRQNRPTGREKRTTEKEEEEEANRLLIVNILVDTKICSRPALERERERTRERKRKKDRERKEKKQQQKTKQT